MRERLPWKLQEIPADLIVPITLATLTSFTIRIVQDGQFSWRSTLATLSTSLAFFLVSFFIGRWFGKSWWPSSGRKLAQRLLKRYTRVEHHDLILTGRADFPPTTNRRIFESVMFMASVQVLLLLALQFVLPWSLLTGERGLANDLTNVPILVLSGYSAVVLVPHWVFGRMGLRKFDKWRFTVTRVTHDYSGRLKISNGALVLIVLGVGGFLLRYRGETDAQAFTHLAQAITDAVLFSLIAAASAVAFYQRRELKIMQDVARSAIRYGARDGRGESHEELASHLIEDKRPRARVLLRRGARGGCAGEERPTASVLDAGRRLTRRHEDTKGREEV